MICIELLGRRCCARGILQDRFFTTGKKVPDTLFARSMWACSGPASECGGPCIKQSLDYVPNYLDGGRLTCGLDGGLNGKVSDCPPVMLAIIRDNSFEGR